MNATFTLSPVVAELFDLTAAAEPFSPAESNGELKRDELLTLAARALATVLRLDRATIPPDMLLPRCPLRLGDRVTFRERPGGIEVVEHIENVALLGWCARTVREFGESGRKHRFDLVSAFRPAPKVSA
jgi:hypothetical protein